MTAALVAAGSLSCGVVAWWVARTVERVLDGVREEVWWSRQRPDCLGLVDALALVELDRVT
jgi:hypothetical protein